MISDHDLAEATARFGLQFVHKMACAHIGDGLHLLSMRSTAGNTVRFLLDTEQTEALRQASESALIEGFEEADLV